MRVWWDGMLDLGGLAAAQSEATCTATQMKERDNYRFSDVYTIDDVKMNCFNLSN